MIIGDYVIHLLCSSHQTKSQLPVTIWIRVCVRRAAANGAFFSQIGFLRSSGCTCSRVSVPFSLCLSTALHSIKLYWIWRDDVDDLERIGRGVLGIPWLLIDGDVRLCLFWGPWNHFESNIAIADTISFPFFHAGVTSPLAEAVCKRDYRL